MGDKDPKSKGEEGKKLEEVLARYIFAFFLPI